MPLRPSVVVIAGALICATGGLLVGQAGDDVLAQGLAAQAGQALEKTDAAQVKADFGLSDGDMPTRHAILSGGESLDEATRAMAARKVAAIRGVGGVYWIDGSLQAKGDEPALAPTHCQDEVEALLRARTIRFEESSASIEAASSELIDEVAAALRPCLGSIIAVTGHTDSSGPEPGNLALSLERARAVREALIARGIPRDGLRARGFGSSKPVEGLAPTDPANRRIEFSVISTVPLTPTPVDTPGAR
ncbi:MAG: OmpA family protein [Sphingomonadaceae bacterium]|nr:OmpA family protein [Sphingomonadaceae bacterium]MCP5383372.1 OmpA family protein [Altererythrobacter sp.]MCP5391250.1 OmpA family protein [Sphingomonadaceae bacterium]MCP5393549.1 OmpA family protein [Sphingomonadaceae bacterium]